MSLERASGRSRKAPKRFEVEEIEVKKKSKKKAVVRRTKKKKVKKDPNAPKRGKTSYIFFLKDVRPQVKADNPDMTFGEIAKECSELWRELGKSDKKEYEALARKDKQRYEKAKAEYEANKSESEDNEDDVDSEDE